MSLNEHAKLAHSPLMSLYVLLHFITIIRIIEKDNNVDADKTFYL